MRRHLVRWHDKYADRGLAIIEIDGGTFEALAPARESVQRQQVKHLVMWDLDRQNTYRYGVEAWPTAYLIGRDGRVVWEGNPARVVDRPEDLAELFALIEAELGMSESTVGDLIDGAEADGAAPSDSSD
jgi:hypothetical protein